MPIVLQKVLVFHSCFFQNGPVSIIGNTGKAYIHLVFFQVEMPLVMKKKENNVNLPGDKVRSLS